MGQCRASPSIVAVRAYQRGAIRLVDDLAAPISTPNPETAYSASISSDVVKNPDNALPPWVGSTSANCARYWPASARV